MALAAANSCSKSARLLSKLQLQLGRGGTRTGTLSSFLYPAAAAARQNDNNNNSSLLLFPLVSKRGLMSMSMSKGNTNTNNTNSHRGIINIKSSSSSDTPYWCLSQRRGVKVLGSEVRPGNIVERKARVYEVIKAQHTQHGRGGASIQVELRDVDSGNKVTERFRTDEAIERVYVEDKCFKYLYTEGDTVVLSDPETFDQLEVPLDMFGKAAAYLQDDMTVTVQFYDERPMSASVPIRVTCKVVEAQAPMKGLSVNPQYKKVLLDNGLLVLAPPFIVSGDSIVVNTRDDSYLTRAK